MIRIKIQIQGEPDTVPFTRIFDYPNESDENIFYYSLGMVKRKLAAKLRINTNEALTLYCGHIVDQLRSHVSVDDIEKSASKVLSDEDVMIGVPQTLSTIKFEAMVNVMSEKSIVLRQPILTTSYILTDNRNADKKIDIQ